MRQETQRLMSEPCAACAGRGHAVANVLKPCPECVGTGKKRIRCRQCWNWRKPAQMIGRRGVVVQRCNVCQPKYANRGKKQSPEQRASATKPRSRISSDGPLRVLFVLDSRNRKTGRIPVSMTSARTCPGSCPLFGSGCYAEQHMIAIHWRRLSDGTGLSWSAFVAKVAALPDGQIWRHNEAGDLPGDGERIDRAKLALLVEANAGRRGFTYTHKPWKRNRAALLDATNRGFTINVSTDSLADADTAAAAGLPVVTVLSADAPAKGNFTPAGRTVVVCPATLKDGVTCQSCKLCAVGHRKSIVGFRAHGDRKGQISERVKQLPMFQGA